MATPIEIAVRTTGASSAGAQLRGVKAQVTGLGGSIKRLAIGGAAIAGITKLTSSVTGFVKSSVSAESEFSTTMRLIAASTKTPAAEMKALNDLAIKLGKDTSFSAQEAAGAMLELAKAGLDTKTIMGGGLAGTLQLAAAGGTDLATASTIASNALNTFNLEGRDMASVAAALAGGANASSASVDSLGQALRQVGPGATNAGLSLQETVAALSAFDAAGIKGSDAGTSLKTMLTRLVPTTAKASEEMKRLGLNFTDSKGEFLSLTQISAELRREFKDLSAAERTKALSTVFGSDATRAATVLMKEGAGGIREFIKATKDQNAAQEMAKARLDGTEGALERLDGSIETVKLRLGQELAPAVQASADGLAKNLGPAMETAIEAGKELGSAVAPAVVAVKDALAGLIPEADTAGAIFNNLLLPALRGVSEVVALAANGIDALPEPIKDIGVQAAIAALILPRLTAAATGAATRVTGAFTTMSARAKQFGAEMTYAQTRTQRLGQTARTAAGIGGILALSQSAQTSNETLKTLTQVGGAALLGFSVGGPIGAAIGGGAAALWKLADAIKGTAAEAQTARTKTLEFKDSLDQVTGAATRQTRELILLGAQQDGIAGLATRMGINQRDLIGAIQGNEGATRRLSAAYRENFGLLDGAEQSDFNTFLRSNTSAFARDTAAVKENAAVLGGWKAALKGLPPKVQTEVKAIGTEISARQVKALKRQYDLTPKQVRTIMQAIGTETMVRKVKGVYKVLDASGKIKADLTPFEQTFLAGLGRVKGDADRGGRAIGDNLRNGTSRARPDLNPFAALFRSQIAGIKGNAASGGQGIGAALGQGVTSGIGAYVGAAIAAAANLVRQAIAAARAEAKAKSPSRKTMQLGRDLGEGLAIGMRRTTGRNRREAKRLIRQITKAADDGKTGLRDRIGKILESRGVKSAKQIKAITAAVGRQTKALLRNADAQSRVSKKLAQARTRLQQARQEYRSYAAGIRDASISYASITNLDAAFNPTAIAAAMQARLAKLRQFTDLIKQLRAQGLNRTTLDQLLQGSVEGGMAYADALASGGQAAITEINQLQSEIGSVAGNLGSIGADSMYGAGVKAAEGLVKGLLARTRELDRVANRLADQLVDAIKKRLGIRSPSTVFRGLGQSTVEGLRIGIETGKGREFGEVLARDLVRGFAEPKLTARAAFDQYTAQQGTGTQEIRVRLTAEQLSRLERGREIALDLHAFRSNGGRMRA